MPLGHHATDYQKGHPIHSLLGGNDGMYCGHETFHNAKVADDFGQGCQALLNAGAFLTILRDLWYFSWFTPSTNMELLAEGVIITFLEDPFK